MSSKYPYISDQYTHLLPHQNINSHANSPHSPIYYQAPQNHHFQVSQYNSPYFQNNHNQLPHHQPITFLPGPQQQFYNNSQTRINHDSYAADDPNPQYPSINSYQRQNHAKTQPNETPQNQIQLIHKIQYGDTLEGLSLLYDIPISKIKQRNNIEGDSIYYLKQITIPNPKVSPIQSAKTQQMIIEELMSFMPFEEKSDKVARFYLQDHNWNVEEALRGFRDDLEWERKNKVKFNSVSLKNKKNFLNYSQQQMLIKKWT